MAHLRVDLFQRVQPRRLQETLHHADAQDGAGATHRHCGHVRHGPPPQSSVRASPHHARTHPPTTRASARTQRERERDLWPSLLLSPTACLLSPLSLERGRGPLPSSTCAAFPQPTVLRSSSSSCPVSSATPLLGQAATQGGALATELPVPYPDSSVSR